jgi:hypothetical protein
LNWLGFANCTSKPELRSIMGQEKSLQRAVVSLGLKHYLKQEIRPTIDQKSQQIA